MSSYGGDNPKEIHAMPMGGANTGKVLGGAYRVRTPPSVVDIFAPKESPLAASTTQANKGTEEGTVLTSMGNSA